MISVPALDAATIQRLSDGKGCLAAALSYLGLGWSSLALCPPDHVGVGRTHGRTCQSRGKCPFGSWKDHQERRATERELRDKWESLPSCNVGVALGPVSGLVGVDVDGEGGEVALQRISNGAVPETLEFSTPGGGRRLLYKIPDGVKLRTTSEQQAGAHAELRLQAKGAQTVMPPSRHRNGGLYLWVTGHRPGEIEPALAPDWLLRELAPDERKSNRKPASQPGKKVREGGRNAHLASLAGSMRRKGSTEQTIFAGIQSENIERCEPPLPEVEVRTIAGSIASYAPAPSENGEHPEVIEAPDDPHRLARLFLAERCRHPDTGTLRFWREEWHSWDGAAYRVVSEKELRAGVTEVAKAEMDRLNIIAQALAAQNGEEPPAARKVTSRLVADVAHALASLTLLPSKIEAPAWVGRKGRVPASEILACRNGLVYLPFLVSGQAHSIPPTPRFFSPNCLDFDFDAQAPSPADWFYFLNHLWPDDSQSIATLQDWMGYLLSPDTRQQKILLIVGPRRSGKGTIARVIRALLGPENVAGPTLSSLGTNFGLWPLLRKTAAIVSDARLSGRTDSATVTERLLSISGEDALTVDRKNLAPVTTKISARFVILTNELPRLGDASGALTGRMIVLRLTASWYGKEDTTLTDRLLAELPSILRWAIVGWQRLRERGHFVQPESSKELVEELEELSSPISAFIEDCCRVGAGYKASVAKLFDRWKTWCETKGRKEPGTEQVFGRDLLAAVPTLRRVQPREGEKRYRSYEGIDLRQG
jgi:putative DNA primase/helicase